MGDWSVLARQDPAPGDPGQVRALGARLLGEAGRIDGVLGRSRALSAGDGALRMDGDYAPKFREALAALPEELGKLGRAYRACGSTLAAFASSLQDAQGRAGSALRQGIDAESRYQAAMREVRALLPPDRAATFSNGLGLRPASVDAATVGLQEQVRAQVRAAAHRAAVADEDLDRARRLADQAAALRDDAESRCVKGVRDALEGSGIKNKPWWQKAWNAATTPFRSWDEFVKVAGKVALVAGIAAMFISGPVGWALMAGALAAGAAVFAGDLDRFARGEVGLGTLAFSALGLIPGGRGVVSVATLGRSLAGMARTVAAGRGGRLLVAGLRTDGTRVRKLASAFPHALGVSGGLRGAVRDPRLFARAFTCRFTGRDPIDLATGEMVMRMTDVELHGLLPLVLQRTYSSAYAAFGVGRWFGAGWSSLLDQRLEVDAAGVCFAFTEAVVLAYPNVTPGQTALPAEGPQLPLSRTADGEYTVHDPATGRTMTFAAPPDEPAAAGPGVVLPLAAISDRAGHRMDLRYDADDGSLAQIRHSGGYVVDVDTDHGLITGFRLQGTAGRDVTLVRYGYDDTGHLTEVINSSGLPLRFSYDTAGRMTSWEDRNGTWYRYTYDQAGRVVRTSGSARCLDGEIRYDTAGRVTVEINSLGHATAYHYNDAWQIERVVNPLGHATSYEWDRYDRKLSQTDPLGRTTRYAYDPHGNVNEVTRPDGRRRVIEWNERHQPVRVVEPDGATSFWAYDDADNLTAVSDPTGGTTRYGYDSHGRLATVTDALGHATRVQTNAAGLPIAVRDPLGATTRIERDDLGRVIGVTDPTGAVTRFEWTVEGRLAARVLPDGATESWRYDAEGNLVEHSDALGQVTRTDLTYFDLPAVRTQPDGSQVACTYDTELRVTSVTDARGLVWRYDYDSAGRLIRETDYDGRVLRYRYDAAGQLIERVNGAGQVTTLTYDTVGNVVRRQAGDEVTVMTYDTAGRLVRATGPDADLEFERDPLGRVLAETVNGRTLTTSYDPVGRRVTRRTPSGIESHWEYDPAGRPAALTTADRRIGFARDDAGRETARHLGTVATLHQTWDAAARLTTQSLTTGAPDGDGTAARSVRERTFQYRADGHITAIEDRRSGLRTFDLDALGRVAAVTGPQWRERYDYDPDGNLVGGDLPAPHAGRVRYAYDGDGRVIQRELVTPSGKRRTWYYRWNAEGRLVGVTTPDGARWRYLYDALGRRVAKQRLGDDDTVIEQIDFTWDATQLAEQTTSTPDGVSTITTWEWEPDSTRPLTQHKRESAGDVDNADQEWIDRQFHAIVTDLVGTPTDLVDETGTVTPQGAAPLWDAAPPDAPCPLRFPGQYHDAESGLHYNLFRHYDPATAAYTSPDPSA